MIDKDKVGHTSSIEKEYVFLQFFAYLLYLMCKYNKLELAGSHIKVLEKNLQCSSLHAKTLSRLTNFNYEKPLHTNKQTKVAKPEFKPQIHI